MSDDNNQNLLKFKIKIDAAQHDAIALTSPNPTTPITTASITTVIVTTSVLTPTTVSTGSISKQPLTAIIPQYSQF